MPLESSYLIQRLCAPVEGTPGKPKPHHVFGGNMLGFRQEAWDTIDPCFTVEYMGSAQFEGGRLPIAFGNIVKASEEYAGFVLKFTKRDIKNHWKRRGWEKRKAAKEMELPEKVKREVYVICRKDLVTEVHARLKDLAKLKVETKESHMFELALDPIDKYDFKTLGWFDLHNEFFFFVDQSMWERTLTTFEIEKAV